MSLPAASTANWLSEFTSMPGLWVILIIVAAGVALLTVVLLLRAMRQPHSLWLSVLEEINAALCRVWYRTRRVGDCTVPAHGPVIITANHTCTADPLLICACCQYRKISFLIAREYSDLRFWRMFVRAADCIPVRRDGRDVAATKQALRYLREGRAVAVFIEGRIPAPGEPIEPRDGVAVLALRSGAPVIPCHINGTKYRESVLGGFLARHRARVRFGLPVDLADLDHTQGRAAVSEATRRIFGRIQALGADDRE